VQSMGTRMRGTTSTPSASSSSVAEMIARTYQKRTSLTVSEPKVQKYGAHAVS
jgi:hypothetical protein